MSKLRNLNWRAAALLALYAFPGRFLFPKAFSGRADGAALQPNQIAFVIGVRFVYLIIIAFVLTMSVINALGTSAAAFGALAIFESWNPASAPLVWFGALAVVMFICLALPVAFKLVISRRANGRAANAEDAPTQLSRATLAKRDLFGAWIGFKADDDAVLIRLGFATRRGRLFLRWTAMITLVSFLTAVIVAAFLARWLDDWLVTIGWVMFIFALTAYWSSPLSAKWAVRGDQPTNPASSSLPPL